MTPQALEKIGIALFGTAWRNQIARYLNVNPGRITDWVNGKYNIPAGIWAELNQLAAVRAKETAAVADHLDPWRPGDKAKIIDQFLTTHASKLLPGTSIYCRATWCSDGMGGEIHGCDLSLEPQSGEGWQRLGLSTDRVHYASQMIHVRRDLLDKLNPSDAVRDESLINQ